jgi:hypothetical protein
MTTETGESMNLPSEFDLWFDVKYYDQLVYLYNQVCHDKATIERLCAALNVPLPTLIIEE